MRTAVTLEIACFNAPAAITASQAGADRIELCTDRSAGGTTPPLSWLTTVKAAVTIPVYVMVRPRGGDFDYTELEFLEMQRTISTYKGHAHGFVFGLLTPDRRVDVARTRVLVEMARPRPCTFHRAFDETKNLLEALEDVCESGCEAILTSGGAETAAAGVEVLAMLVQRAAGRVVVMPGGGVRASNVQAIREATGAVVLHSSAVLGDSDEPDIKEIAHMRELATAPLLR